MVTKRKRRIVAWLLGLFLVIGAVVAHYAYDPWGFYWKASPEEAALRMDVAFLPWNRAVHARNQDHKRLHTLRAQ